MKEKDYLIIIADDAESVRNLVYVFAKKAYPNSNILTCNNGQELLERVAETKNLADLIITDHYMPAINGFDAIKILRKKRISSPVLIMTAAPEEILPSYEESKPNRLPGIEKAHLLRKPFSYASFLEITEGLLKSNSPSYQIQTL